MIVNLDNEQSETIVGRCVNSPSADSFRRLEIAAKYDRFVSPNAWDTSRPALPFAALAYVFRDGLVATVTRRDTGALSVPGGKLDPGESAEDACFRELLEESSLVATSMVPIYRAIDEEGHDAQAFLVEAIGDLVSREPGIHASWQPPYRLAISAFCPLFHRASLRAAGMLASPKMPGLPAKSSARGYDSRRLRELKWHDAADELAATERRT